MINYYQILNVPTNASPEEITASYNNLIKINHPDNNISATDTEKKEFVRKTQLINEAYSCLRDLEKRRKYDIQIGIYVKNRYVNNNTQSKKTTTKKSTQFKQNNALSYDFILYYLNKKYKQKTMLNGIIVYYNDSQQVVGLNNNSILTLYFDCPSDKIWNHNNHVMIGIAKSFPVLNNNQYTLCDIITMSGMVGTPNMYRKNGFFIENIPDFNISNNNLGSIGFFDDNSFYIYTEKGNIKIKLNKTYNAYSYPDNISFNILIEGNSHNLTTEEKQLFLNQFKQIKKDYNWYWNQGFNTRGSKETRANIDYLGKNISNYHTKTKASINTDFELSNREISTEKDER